MTLLSSADTLRRESSVDNLDCSVDWTGKTGVTWSSKFIVLLAPSRHNSTEPHVDAINHLY